VIWIALAGALVTGIVGLFVLGLCRAAARETPPMPRDDWDDDDDDRELVARLEDALGPDSIGWWDKP
jgi:hypothetical protein